MLSTSGVLYRHMSTALQVEAEPNLETALRLSLASRKDVAVLGRLSPAEALHAIQNEAGLCHKGVRGGRERERERERGVWVWVCVCVCVCVCVSLSLSLCLSVCLSLSLSV